MLIFGRSGQVRECNFPSSIPSRELNISSTDRGIKLTVTYQPPSQGDICKASACSFNQ